MSTSLETLGSILSKSGDTVTLSGGGSNITLSGGNVGIGTTSPSAKLEVKNTPTGYYSQFLQIDSPLENSEFNLYMIQFNTPQNPSFQEGIGIAPSFKTLWNDSSYSLVNHINSAQGEWGVFSTGWNVNLAVNPRTGTTFCKKLGIGTTTPERTLHLSGSNTIIRIDRDRPDPTVMLSRFPEGELDGTPYKTFGFSVIADGADQGSFNITDFHQAVSGPNDVRLCVDTNGNVGIGTTNPLTELHVNGEQGILISDDNRQISFNQYYEGGWKYAKNGYGCIIKVNNSGDLEIYNAGNNTNGSGASSSPSRNMVIRNNGNVGIGTTTPTRKLTVDNYNGFADNGIAVIAHANNYLAELSLDSDKMCLIGQCEEERFYFYWRFEGIKYILLLGAMERLFTGQHKSFSETISRKDVGKYKGLIVVSSGKHKTISNNDSIKFTCNKNDINNAHPLVNLSSKPYQKSVYGVISNYDDKNTKTDDSGNIIYDEEIYQDGFFNDLHERIRINSLGEGSIWVTNENGNIENGDYIVTSSIPGYGMKQDDDIMRSCTVAKCTVDCDFIERTVPREKLKVSKIIDDTSAITHIIETDSSNIPIFEHVKISDLRTLNEGEEDGIVIDNEYDFRYFYNKNEISKKEYDKYYLDEDNHNLLLIGVFLPCTYHCG